MSPRQSPSPRVCVLAPSLRGDEDVVWAQRLALDALAAVAEVHLLHLGSDAESYGRGGVTLHPVGPAIGPQAELRRDLLVSQFSAPSDGRGAPGADPTERVDALLPRDTDAAWQGAGALMVQLAPDLIVVLDHRDRGVTVALDLQPGVPVALIPLVDTVASPGRAHYDALFARADHIAVFSEAEERVVRARTDAPITRVEPPVDPEPQGTPPRPAGDRLGGEHYVLVITAADGRNGMGPGPWADLIACALPEESVVFASQGGTGTTLHRHGRRRPLPGADGGPDLQALMEGAAVLVDLHPGRLVARRCINALRKGTPIIVPEQSRAIELCARGKGGLWFSNAGELLWAIEALGRPDLGPVLGEQGRRYCDAHHGSFDRFAQQMAVACGLPEGSTLGIS